MKRLLQVFVFCCLAAQMSGCVNVATSGVQAIYHRKSLQNSFKDQLATIKAHQEIKKEEAFFAKSNIEVTTFNGDMLVTGQVPRVEQKERIEILFKQIDGVNRLYNLLEIDRPISTFTSMNDSWLTTKVKSRMIASDEMDASQIKVVTQNRTVYLMGVLPPDEAEVAVHVARSTRGVEHVVKIFSYMRVSRN